MSDQDFNWYNKDEESIVIQAVSAVAVYTNVHGDIVIRQQSATDEKDHAVYFPASQAQAIIKAIKAAATSLKKPS